MNKAKLVLLMSIVLIISVISVGGVWAGPSGQTSKVSGTASGAGGQVISGDEFVKLVTENPPSQGKEIIGAATQIGCGTVCFVAPWGSDVSLSPTIMKLDNGSWVPSGSPTVRQPVKPGDAGITYCSEVCDGTFGFVD